MGERWTQFRDMMAFRSNPSMYLAWQEEHKRAEQAEQTRDKLAEALRRIERGGFHEEEVLGDPYRPNGAEVVYRNVLTQGQAAEKCARAALAAFTPTQAGRTEEDE